MGTETKKSWFGWVKNVISAVAGAVISCAATIGIIGTNDADIAKNKIDGWMNKADTAYIQVVEAQQTVEGVIQLVKDGKYLDAISTLSTVQDNAVTTVTTIKELKDEIAEAAKFVADEVDAKKDELKDKHDEVIDTVKEEIGNIKDAIEAKPVKEVEATPAPAPVTAPAVAPETKTE